MTRTIEERIRSLISRLEDTEYTREVYVASGPGVVRSMIEQYVEVHDLIEMGSASAEVLVEKFREAPSQANDVALCCFALVLEKVKYLPAVPILAEFLEEYDEKIVDEHDLKILLWSPHLVTHTLKILTDQVDVDERHYTYYKEQREWTVERAWTWLDEAEPID